MHIACNSQEKIADGTASVPRGEREGRFRKATKASEEFVWGIAWSDIGLRVYSTQRVLWRQMGDDRSCPSLRVLCVTLVLESLSDVPRLRHRLEIGVESVVESPREDGWL